MKKQTTSDLLTKQSFTETLTRFTNAFRNEIKFIMNETVEKIDENAKHYRNELLTKLDGIAADLEAMREESIITSHQIRDLRTQDANHERRIKDLESDVQKAA